MTVWLSAGILFTFTAIAFVLYRWGNVQFTHLPLSPFYLLQVLMLGLSCFR